MRDALKISNKPYCIWLLLCDNWRRHPVLFLTVQQLWCREEGHSSGVRWYDILPGHPSSLQQWILCQQSSHHHSDCWLGGHVHHVQLRPTTASSGVVSQFFCWSVGVILHILCSCHVVTLSRKVVFSHDVTDRWASKLPCRALCLLLLS